jgi:uncharacterized membrane protein
MLNIFVRVVQFLLYAYFEHLFTSKKKVGMLATQEQTIVVITNTDATEFIFCPMFD